MTTLFKHDKPEDAGYFITSAMRQAFGRLKKHREPWRAGAATYDWEHLGFYCFH